MTGFYLLDVDSYSDSLKCYVNLSTNCWETINSDIRFFSLYQDKITLSGFLNTIIKNFYMSSKASIQSLLLKKKEELDLLLDKKYGKNNNTLREVKNDLVEKYYDELKKENLSYPKGSGHYFRINLELANILNDNVENQDIKDAGDSIGCFFKVILEEYSNLPQSSRERIYFKEIIDVIEDAIRSSHCLKVIQRPFERIETNSNGDVVKVRRENKYYVKPYKVVSDESYQYLYLICLSKIIPNNDNGNEEAKYEPHAFRISLLQRATKLNSMNGFISKEMKNEIERRMLLNGPQNLYDPDDPMKILNVKVRFDDRGLETLQRISYGRPKSFEKIDEHTYIFKSDFYRARNYFWRFADSAEIIEPENLRESIVTLVKSTYGLYKIKNW